MNIQRSLQKEAYWTPKLVVVERLHQFNPQNNSKHFLRKVYSISGDFACILLNINSLSDKVESDVFK